MAKELSLFQQKYNDFVNDLLGALPEYTTEIQTAAALDEEARLEKFKTVKVQIQQGDDTRNPRMILPGVEISEDVWVTLTEPTQKAMWEHLRLVSMCFLMETGFSEDNKPAWMDDAMNDMKSKLEGDEFQNMIKKFMEFFKDHDSEAGNADDEDADASKPKMPNFESFFEKGMPKLPEKFMNGHLVRLAQEIVKDIKPEDLGLDPEMLADCEKDPSRAFSVLFSTFKNNPGIIQKVIAKIGNRIQQKVKSGSIRVEEIAKEAEELIKEFSDNPSFVEMMEGIKKAFGFEDMGMAKKAGKESSARLAMVRDRLRKKLDKRKQAEKK
jgi:hypothetical protein